MPTEIISRPYWQLVLRPMEVAVKRKNTLFVNSVENQ